MGSVEHSLSLGYAVSPAPFNAGLSLDLPGSYMAQWCWSSCHSTWPSHSSSRPHKCLCFSEQSLEGEDVVGFRPASGLATLGHLSSSGPIPVAGERIT